MLKKNTQRQRKPLHSEQNQATARIRMFRILKPTSLLL